MARAAGVGRTVAVVLCVALAGVLVWASLRSGERPPTPLVDVAAGREPNADPIGESISPAPGANAASAAKREPAGGVEPDASSRVATDVGRVWIRLTTVDDAPLANLAFRADDRSCTTDAEGVAAIPAVRRLRLAATGFLPILLRLREPRRPDGAAWPIVLRRAAALSGVVAREDGVGVAGVRVSASAGFPFRGGGAPRVLSHRSSTRTDRMGRFGFEALPSGVGILLRARQAPAVNYRHAERIVLAPGERRDVLVTVPTTGSVLGRVVDRMNRPVPKATIACAVGGVYRATTSTDEDGQYRIDGVAPGEVVVRLGGHGLVALTKTVAASARAPETRVDFQTARDLWIAGVVLDEAAQPIPVTQVTADSLAHDHTVHATTTEDGRFALGPLFPGTYRLTTRRRFVEFDLRPNAPQPIVAAGVRDVTLQFVTPGRVSAVLRDQRGRPIEAPVDFLARDTFEMREGRSNADGELAVDLRPGTWDAVCRTEGMVAFGLVVEAGRTREVVFRPAHFGGLSLDGLLESLPHGRSYRARLMRGSATVWLSERVRRGEVWGVYVPRGDVRVILERTDGPTEVIQRNVRTR